MDEGAELVEEAQEHFLVGSRLYGCLPLRQDARSQVAVSIMINERHCWTFV